MKTADIQVTDGEALDYLDDMLTWWRRRGRPEMRAKARRAQSIVNGWRKECAGKPNQQESVA